MARYPRAGTLARDIADAYHTRWCGPHRPCANRFHACEGTIDPQSLDAIMSAIKARRGLLQ